MSARQDLAGASRGAIISSCGQFRYHLHRQWDVWKSQMLFVMLNPSTADADQDDATIRRCVNFAAAHGHGSIEVVNLFAYRATDPAELRRAGFPVGPATDDWITAAAEQASESGGSVCVAWGAHAAHEKANARVQQVMPLLRAAGVEPQCLRITRSGYPQHPLMLPSSCRLMPFSAEAIEQAMGN